MAEQRIRVSVIVLNYKTPDLTIRAVQTAQQSCGDMPCEVFVVDNGSQDESIKRFSEELTDIILIDNRQNLGFSAGNNVAIRRARGEYILLLNSDTEVIDTAISQSVSYMARNRKVGILGCRVELPDGRLDHACRRGFPTPNASLYYYTGLAKKHPQSPKYAAYTLSYLDECAVSDVDAVMGAFLLIRRDTLDQIGLLDEAFFMYGEDLDWCYRAKQEGWSVVYFPEARIIHHKYGSRSKRQTKTIKDFYRAMRIFYHKHYKGKYPAAVTLLVLLGINLKLGLALMQNTLKRK